MMDPWTYGMCVSSEYLDDVLMIAPDALGEEGSNAQYRPIQPLGLIARPSDPTDGKGAGCLYAGDGDDVYAMPTTDPRAVARQPQGSKGSTTLHATGEKISYVHLDGETGYQQILVKYGDKSLSINLDTSSSGQESLQIRHGEGHGIALTADGKMTLNSPNGQSSIEINDTEIILNGNVKVVGGFLAGGPSGNKVLTTLDATAMQAMIMAHTAGLTAFGSPVASTVPLVLNPPGAPNVAAAP